MSPRREKAWRAYVKFLGEECAKLETYASVHGFMCPEATIEEGKRLRMDLGLPLDSDWGDEEDMQTHPPRSCAICNTLLIGVGAGTRARWECPRCDPSPTLKEVKVFSDHPGYSGLHMTRGGEPVRSRKVTESDGGVRLVEDPDGDLYHDLGAEIEMDYNGPERVVFPDPGPPEHTSFRCGDLPEEEPPQPFGFDYTEPTKEARAQAEAALPLLREKSIRILAKDTDNEALGKMNEALKRLERAAEHEGLMGQMQFDVHGVVKANDESARRLIADLEVRMVRLSEDVDRRLRKMGA